MPVSLDDPATQRDLAHADSVSVDRMEHRFAQTTVEDNRTGAKRSNSLDRRV